MRRQHGSLDNQLAESTVSFPIVGMGATQIRWTDRDPYTIICVRDQGKTIDVQEDTAVRTDKNGMCECQSYTYEPNPKGDVVTVTKRRNGQWIASGETVADGRRFVIGRREKYHDYSF